MDVDLYGLSDMAERMQLGSEGHRALREAAKHGALGPVASTFARADLWPDEGIYRAALFMCLHARIGMSARDAATVLAHVDREALAEAIAATRRGDRWAFDLSHVARDVVPVTSFRPWSAARMGTAFEADGPPIARTIVDLAGLWGWIDPPAEDDAEDLL